MSSILNWLVDPSGLTPHGFCLSWEPGLIWLHAASDVLIGLAYFSIPAVLARFAMKRPDFGMGRVLWLFTIFIMACGTTHFLAVLTLWIPAYGLEGVVKALTALVSVATAVLLWPLLPKALAIPAPATLQRLNTALGDSEARLRVLYNETPAAMHTLDEHGNLVGVNDEWTRLLGHDRATVLGRPLADVLATTSAEEHRSTWPSLAATEVVRNIERRFRRADGSVLDTLVSLRRQTDPAEGVVRFLCVVTDISDRKRTEAALHQAQKMEAIGRLTGGVAHDFNNMLTAIHGSLELLRNRLNGEPRALRLVDTALQAATRAASLTAQLLSFARKQRLEPRALPPAQVLAGLSDLLAHTAGPRIALRLEVAPEQSSFCMADPSQLESALLNLVVNATHAISGDGEITVAVRDVDVPAPIVDPEGVDETIEPGTYVRIAVTDTGSGMTEPVRRQAFDPFFTTRAPGEGSGLGLSQIQGFVHQSGGHVRIASRLGHGTTVEVMLPVTERRPEDSQEPGPDEASPSARQGETILVVEDEASVRAVTASMLRAMGYRVVQAEDGAGALAVLAEQADIAAVLTDVVMPGEPDGIGLARSVAEARPGLGVLLVTAFSTLPDRATWPPNWRYLAKPYAATALAHAVRDTIEHATRPAREGDTAPLRPVG